MRRCRVCGTKKVLDDFPRSKSHALGRKGLCKACDNERRRKLDIDQPEKAKARHKKWLRENREHVLAYWAKWRDANRGRMAAYSRKSHQKHMKKVVARVNGYLRAHPEKRRQFKTARRARESGSSGSHTAAEIAELFASYLGLCVYCRGRAVEPDHIVPLAAGGSNGIENLVPACRRCNRSKKDKPLLVWMARRERNSTGPHVLRA